MSRSDSVAGLAQLSARYSLPAGAEAALQTLASLLTSDATAPTSVRDERAVVEDHLADSLVALELDEVRRARAIADLGSGAGLPGLVLAAALPDASVWLIESSARKCAFLERARSACRLDNARVVNTRAEAWTAGLGQCELVTARALSSLPVVAEYAAPLLVVGGSLVAWRGARDSAEEAGAARAATELGLQPMQPRRVHPYPGTRRRHLHLMLKVRPTPSRFPRRPGMATKRPLATRPQTGV